MAEVPAAAQALAILRFLARQAGPVQAGTITRELHLPRSTTYHLLATLQAEGFVVHLPEDRRYALGIGAYELGTGYTRQAPLQRLARVPLATLVDRTRQSAHLAVLHGRDVIYVIEERAPGRPPLVTDVDVRLPAQLTASGRAMLAALPAQYVRALFPNPGAFVLRNERGPQSQSALRQLLVTVRRDGYAVENGEVTPGFASIAAAVLDHAQHPIASVALTFADIGVDASRRDQLARRVIDTAARISRRFSGSGN
ncbi:MAG: IclR family transcriptional regulator [Jatrophihabitantaceae bacterium]